MTDPNTPEYDEHGVAWHPTEGSYSPPDVVAQEPPPHNLDDLRVAVQRGERLHFTMDQVALDENGTPIAVQRLRYDDVTIMPESSD